MPTALRILASHLFVFSFLGAAVAREPNDFERFRGMPVSLTAAVELVENESKGRVVHIAFEVEHDRSVWNADALTDTGMFAYRIDATSRRLVGVVEKSIRGRVYVAVTDLSLADLRAAKVSVAEAVAFAERDAAATAEQLEVIRSGSRIEFAIRLRAATSTRSVRIDASNGEILSKH
jgi:uncharacterized membrane protein YkoI